MPFVSVKVAAKLGAPNRHAAAEVARRHWWIQGCPVSVMANAALPASPPRS